MGQKKPILCCWDPSPPKGRSPQEYLWSFYMKLIILYIFESKSYHFQNAKENMKMHQKMILQPLKKLPAESKDSCVYPLKLSAHKKWFLPVTEQSKKPLFDDFFGEQLILMDVCSNP